MAEKIKELGGKTWEELELVQAEDGHKLVRDSIKERNPKTGEIKEVPVFVRIPRPRDLIVAKAEARSWFATFKGLDVDRDSEMFDEMEKLCLLAKAIRTADGLHPQLASADELSANFEEGSLADLMGRLSVYRDMTDPRESAMTAEELWPVIKSVAQAGHLGPLTGIDGLGQTSCLVFMAVQAMTSPSALAWLQSFETSTQEP